MYFGAGPAAEEYIHTNFAGRDFFGNGENALRPCPVMFLAVQGLLDACLHLKSFYEALLYEVNTLQTLKKYINAQSVYKRWNGARREWTNTACAFLDNYRNREWTNHYMCGWIPQSDEKIEMIPVEEVIKNKDGTVHRIRKEGDLQQSS